MPVVIRAFLFITLVGIVLLELLFWYLQKPKETSELKPPISTSKIEETNLKWEDIVDVDISGFEGDIVANITYKEIPDLQEKINKEEAKWKSRRAKCCLSFESVQGKWHHVFPSLFGSKLRFKTNR